MTIKKLNRREFLGTSAAFACSAMLPAVVDAGEVLPSPSKSLPYVKDYQPGVNSAWIRKGSLEQSSDLIDAVEDHSISAYLKQQMML